MIQGRVLLIDDDANLRRVLKVNLERNGFYVVDADGGAAGLEKIVQESFDVVVSDLSMPDVGGLEVLEAVKRDFPETAVVLITGYGTVETAVKAMKDGAFDYLTKPFERDELVMILRKALRIRRLERENKVLKATVRRGHGLPAQIVARSEAMQRIVDMVHRVAPTDASVLILGESGTGKELVARALHEESARSRGPMVVVNCAAIPETLMESQLFGHRRGSFTGAVDDQEGFFQAADGGTIFLDEIGELRAELQARLLRVLESGEVQRIGDTRTARVDVRVLAATNRDVASGVREGWFREDLFYRLNVITIHVPPLRERAGDLEALVGHFLREFGGGRVRGVSPEALACLKNYRWPGNIRELKNVLERAAILCGGDLVTPDHLPVFTGETLGRKRGGILFDLPEDGIDLENVEKSLIAGALDRFGGNQTKAARYLNISRPTLIYRMEKYGLRSTPPGA